jgi:hypothetical protein
MSVPLGRSPPVLRAGVRWAKLELAWRFGSPVARPCGSGAAKAAGSALFLTLHGWGETNGFLPLWLLFVQK